MPPFSQYWLPYLLFAVAAGVLLWASLPYLSVEADAPKSNAPVLLGGVIVAFSSLIAATWTGWRSSRMQHTISALQSLRTDREYIIAGTIVKRRHAPTGAQISDDLLAELLNPRPDPGAAPDKPTFAESVDFILNQYEFLAVAVRNGVMDETMLRQTIRGSICGLVESFAPYLKARRQSNPQIGENLIWLYLRFTPKRSFDLPDIGPLRRPGWPNR